jgi:hypothetical protein
MRSLFSSRGRKRYDTQFSSDELLLYCYNISSEGKEKRRKNTLNLWLTAGKKEMNVKGEV